MQKIIQLHILLLFFVVSGSLYAQQDPMYSMYMFDKALINPGYTGSSDWMVSTLKYRQQFTGFEGNPVTQTFNFHSPINRRKMGIGFKVINDKLAIMSNLNASLIYAYHLNFAGGKLSLGLEAGIYSRTISYSELILATRIDDAIPQTSESDLVPDASWGLYYQKKQFYLGFSQYHLIKSDFDVAGVSGSKSNLANHMNFLLGNVFNSTKKLSIETSTLVKYIPAAPVQLDFNVTFFYKERIGIGAQYRTNDAFVALLKINILESLRVAYSYDMTLSDLATYSTGAHEIILSYGIKLPPPASEKEVHPRYYF